MNKDLVAIFEYLEREKGIKRDVVIDAIRESLEMAARKSVHGAENVSVTVHGRTGEIEVFCDKCVVEKVSNPMVQISLQETAQSIPDCEIGQIIRVPTDAQDLGRVAAQRARQIISQKLREAERDVIQEEYRHKMNTLVFGTVKKVVRGNCFIVDLGKVEGVLPRRNYSSSDSFDVGHKVLALLSEVRDTEQGGAEVVLSRTDPEFVRQLLIREIQEVSDGTITVERIVREPGFRTKLIVKSHDLKVDPVGACIGVRGIRIKNVIRELNGEKIDVIPYIADAQEQLEQSLSPVVIRKLNISEDGESVLVVVDDEDFPISIGKKGVNVRLLGQLMGVQLKIQRITEYLKLRAIERAAMATSDDEALDLPLTNLEGVPAMVVDQLVAEGFSTPRSVLAADPELISQKLGGMSIGVVDKVIEQILESIRKQQRA